MDSEQSELRSFLSTAELAAKFPVEDAQDGERAWYRLILRLRDKGQLREGQHWRYRRDGERSDTRVYLEAQVLKLLWNSDRAFAEKIRIQHRALILSIVNGVTNGTIGTTVSSVNGVKDGGLVSGARADAAQTGG